MNVLQLLKLIRHRTRAAERPEPGQPPARIEYFTVHTASGKRVVNRTVTLPTPDRGRRL